jgi:hypothetical protein
MLKENILNYTTILNEVRKVYSEHYGIYDLGIVESVFHDIINLFSGRRKGFQECDTTYHDLLHTLQVIPPFIGIIDGWNKSKNSLKISKEYFDIGMIAVLLHDTGYIKTADDADGTGAKYTFVHIQRSADFAEQYLSQLGFERQKINSVHNIIMCTGVKVDLAHLPFQSEEERIIGYTLGTADLLGQMAAPDYLKKLYALFSEFDEAYHFEGKEKLKSMGLAIFDSAEDLIRHTPHFYEYIVKKRFEHMGGMYRYLSFDSSNLNNSYISAIEKNIMNIKRAYTTQ